MAVMSSVSIETASSYYQEASQKYASQVPDDVLTNPKSFHKFSQEIYQRFLDINLKDPVKGSRFESIVQHLKNNKNFKTTFMTEKNYLDFNDK